jgi:hypothetical protein
LIRLDFDSISIRFRFGFGGKGPRTPGNGGPGEINNHPANLSAKQSSSKAIRARPAPPGNGARGGFATADVATGRPVVVI